MSPIAGHRQSPRGSPGRKLSATVGSLVRQTRIQRGLTQAELGTPRATRAMVSAVELGKVAPSLGLLRFFAQKLKVRMRDLMPDR